MDYLKHFKLADSPFKNAYDGRFFYRSPAAENIFQTLKTADLPSVIHLKGQDKVGKTFLLKRLGAELKPIGRPALVLNPRLTLRETLREALADFGHSHKFSLETPEEELLGYYQNAVGDLLAEGARVFLAVDNADDLPPAMLTELYGLTELEPRWNGQAKLLLCGSAERPWPLAPDLMPEIRELTLPPLSAAETEDYVAARLKAAGGRPLFSRPALKMLGELGGGRPELINRLAERALIAAWSAGRAEAGPAQVKAAQNSLAAPLDYERLAAALPAEKPRRPAPRGRRPLRRPGPRAALALLALGFCFYLLSPGSKNPPRTEPSRTEPSRTEPSPMETPPMEQELAEVMKLTAAPAAQDAATPAGGGFAPSLPTPPSQVLTLPQGALALALDQDAGSGRLWQGGARGPGLKAEVAAPVLRRGGLFLFGRPRGRDPLIFQYPPAGDPPVAEALTIWSRLATLLPQNALPVLAAPARILNAPGRAEDLGAVEKLLQAWVQAQQYKFPDTLAALYASDFQFFEPGQPVRRLNRENFRRALNSEAGTSGDVDLAISQPLFLRDPQNDHLIWAVFNIKYESRLRRDAGLRVLVFEKPFLAGQEGWLIAAELWVPEKSPRGN